MMSKASPQSMLLTKLRTILMYPAPLKGLEAIRKDAENFFRAFPDIRVEFLHLMSKADTVMGESCFYRNKYGVT